MRQFVLLTVLLLSLVATASSASDPFSLSGTVTNTTNPSKPIIGSAVISFDDKGDCVIQINAPLYGSGLCSLTNTDDKGQQVTLISAGPSGQITWTGTASQDGFIGSYEVHYPDLPQLPERGTFAFQYDKNARILKLDDVLSRGDFTDNGQTYRVIVERDIAYLYDGESKYRGLRFVLDDKSNPLFRIEDHKDGSLFIDLRNNSSAMEWHTDGKDGYFSKTANGITSYYDRFMNYTSWSSVNTKDQTIYCRESADSIELYDASFKPLNIRSAKNSSGKVYWTRTYDNGVTEYFDDSMNSLNWYSMPQNGQTYYAHAIGKKFKVYDSNFRLLPGKPGFWTKFGRGMAIGLAAYGQALQAQAANQSSSYSQPSTAYQTNNSSTSYQTNTQQIGNFGYSYTTGSDGSSYNTTTQRIGNFEYSNTNGSNGYYASTTRQKIGNFDYVNGYSSNGSISGNGQQIGNFNYSHYSTPTGNWNGTSQQIGNFTYHTITAPDGTVHTGTTQRIGDFLYTTVH